MALFDDKEKAVKDLANLQSLRQETALRTNGKKALLEEMLDEKEASLNNQIYGEQKGIVEKVKDFFSYSNETQADEDGVVCAIPRKSSGFDITEYLPSFTPKGLATIVLTIALGYALLSNVGKDKDVEHSGEGVSVHYSKSMDPKKYFTASLGRGSEFFTAHSFPNHMRTPKTKLEKVVSRANDPAMIYAILEQESKWDPLALAPKRKTKVKNLKTGEIEKKWVRAGGLGQPIVPTANASAKALKLNLINYPFWVQGKKFTELNPCKDPKQGDWRFDPVSCARFTVNEVDNKLSRQFKDPRLVIAAYNCGPGNVRKAMNKAKSTKFEKVFKYLPKETKKYVQLVSEKRNLYNMIVPIESGKQFQVFSLYGYRNDPFDGSRKFHTGIDLSTNSRPGCVAVLDGEVIYAGNHKTNGYGKQVWLRDHFGNIFLYGHLSKYSVRTGDKVKQGKVVGIMGKSGRSTGEHLHFGLYDMPLNSKGHVNSLTSIKGALKNPMRYINKKIILKKKQRNRQYARR